MNTAAKQHPIQLETVLIKELSVKLNVPIVENSSGGSLQVHTGHSDFDEEEKKISVGLMARSDPEKDTGIDLHVEILGVFTVSPEFPKEHLSDWAQKNAPFLLYPFLREQVYGLTIRAGISPILLPLVEIPRQKKE